MDVYTATEEAYKNGYKEGWKDGRKSIIQGEAEWIPLPSIFGVFTWKVKCNKCGCTEDRQQNYCSNCGRKMKLINRKYGKEV